MNIGSHLSIARGMHSAIEKCSDLGFTCLQIFTKNSNSYAAKPISKKAIDLFSEYKLTYKIEPIITHASYLINLASPDDAIYQKSMASFILEIERSSLLKIPYIVIHPGSHRGSGSQKGIKRVQDAINLIHTKLKKIDVTILLETTAGQGTNLGYTFYELSEIISGIKNSPSVGVCLDTCHIFAAGYDIRERGKYRETISLFDKVIGLMNLKVIHLNDSKKELASRLDRHEHIGKGFIGQKGFKNIMQDERLEKIPMILETAKDDDGTLDITNMNILLKLKGKKLNKEAI